MSEKHVLIVFGSGQSSRDIEKAIVFDDRDRAVQAFFNREFGPYCALMFAQHNTETKLPEPEQMTLNMEETDDSPR